MNNNYVLVCGFKGDNNTAKLILDKINTNNKLYLENDFDLSVKQLFDLMNNNYDYIIMLGQKPKVKSLYIETQGSINNDIVMTNYNVNGLEKCFSYLDYKVTISHNAGNYLCNNIYYHCLKYINRNLLNTKAVFLHVPTIKNIFDIDKFSKDLSDYIKLLSKKI